MRIAFISTFRGTNVIAGLFVVISAVLFILTAAGGEPTVSRSVLVDRLTKADRLPNASTSKNNLSSWYRTPQVQRPPIGCDAAFSVVADLTHAHIYGRCAA